MNIKRWLVSIALIFVVIASLGFVKFQQIQAAIAFGESFPEPSGSVKSEVVTTQPVTNKYEVVGEAKATKSLMLTTEFAGPITFLGYEPGDNVKAGQVLLRQDTSIDEANLKAAQARHKLAKAQYSRQATLLNQKRTSQNDVDIAEADMSIAAAEIERLSSVIAKKTIIAPFDGTVGLDDYQVGQLLDVNTTVTRLIGNSDEIWIDFSLPQTAIQPDIGNSITVSTIGQNSRQFQAYIIARNPQINETSRQVSYRASLDNEDRQITPNQMVNIVVEGKKVNTVLVPINAIYRDHTGSYVYLLKQDEQNNWRAHAVAVTLGKRMNNKQVVLSGLSGNEFIATEGAFKLSEGLLVYTQAPDKSRGRGEQP